MALVRLDGIAAPPSETLRTVYKAIEYAIWVLALAGVAVALVVIGGCPECLWGPRP